jgi:calcineurin-like phosphoesterase family protein
MNLTFFVADTHFNHRGIIKHASRPYQDADEMDEDIIRVWNCVVPPNADVWHLGDVAWDLDTLRSVIPRLNGRIRVIWGNHDSRECRRVAGLIGIVESHEYKEIKLDGQHITLCHYPMRVWNKSSKGAWMLHGHCHGNLDDYPAGRVSLAECGWAKTMDVGWDIWQRPLEFDEIKSIMEPRNNLVVDHHGS